MKHNINRTTILTSALVILSGLFVVFAVALPGYGSVIVDNVHTMDSLGNNNSYSALVPTSNMIAAGGPIPPNYTLAQQEAECAAVQENRPWFRTVMPTEMHDSARTNLFACAQFPGSYTGPNNVYAYPSSDMWFSPFNMATRSINEMYIYGGGTGDAIPPALHTFVARVEPGTLKELWRTFLNNANITDEFHISGSVDVLADGSLGVTADHTLYKINANTGAVEAVVNLPTGNNPPKDSAFNGFSAFPDGTLVLKSFNRPVGCTFNGYSAAVNKCPGAPASANPSVLSVVDSKTWKVLDWVQTSENSADRVSTTQFNGKNYAYFAGTSSVFRYVWDGKNIALDKTWGPVPYLKPGQSIAGAAGAMGNWVVLTTNGSPVNVSMSVVAISQANASKITRIDPIPLKPGQQSTYYGHGAVDPENNRIYAMDAGVHKAFAVNIDPNTGNMSVAWVEPEWSQADISLIGPAYKRVFVGTNMSSNVTQSVTKINPWPAAANYVEQIQWRDATTGKLLAASDFFPSAAYAAPIPVGYGGLIYDMLNKGNIIALQVLPESNTTSSAVAATTTTNTTAAVSPTSGTMPASS